MRTMNEEIYIRDEMRYRILPVLRTTKEGYTSLDYLKEHARKEAFTLNAFGGIEMCYKDYAHWIDIIHSANDNHLLRNMAETQLKAIEQYTQQNKEVLASLFTFELMPLVICFDDLRNFLLSVGVKDCNITMCLPDCYVF